MQDGREDEPVARMEGVSESADAKLIAISSRFRSVGRVMRRSSPQGLRGSPCGDACCAVDRQRSPEDAIRSKVFLGLDVEQFGKARASAVHPALDGADLRPANLGGFFIAQPFRPDQEQNLTLLQGKLRERRPEVLEIEPGVLFRWGGEARHR